MCIEDYGLSTAFQELFLVLQVASVQDIAGLKPTPTSLSDTELKADS